MPDITMCEPTSCNMKEWCYRYTATPSERQAYCDFSNCGNDEGGRCVYFEADMKAITKNNGL